MSLWAMVLHAVRGVSRIERELKAIEVAQKGQRLMIEMVIREQAAQRAILEQILQALTPAPAVSLEFTLGTPQPQ